MSAANRDRNRTKLGLESLESREVPANLDMTQVALDHGVRHANPTHIYLNFDGDGGTVTPYTNGTAAQTDLDIQDILYRTSEVFAPFDVEVTRMAGKGNAYWGNDGSTTVFVGPNSQNVKAGVKYPSAATPAEYSDGPGGHNPTDHRPNSYGHKFAYVDPFGNGNALQWSPSLITEALAHEAGHTFGLAHVRTDGLGDPILYGTGTVGEIMSYNNSPNSVTKTYFANPTTGLPITTGNYNPKSGGIDFTNRSQPAWGTVLLLIPDPIITQNSFTYLRAVLGERPADSAAHVADKTAVDPTVWYSQVPQIAIGMNAPTAGYIARDGDYHVYQVSPSANGTIRIYAPTTGRSLSVSVMVHDAAGQLLTLTPNGSDGYTLPVVAGQPYFVIVGGQDGQGTGLYHLNVESLYPVAGVLSIHVTVAGGTVTLDTNSFGGLRVVSDAVVTDFLPGEVKSVTIDSLRGSHQVNVLATPRGVTVAVTGGAGSRDVVTAGGGTLAAIGGPVNVGNALGMTRLIVNDSAERAATRLEVTSNSVAVATTGFGTATVRYSAGVTAVRVVGGGAADFVVVSSSASAPLTLVAGGGLNTVFVGAVGQSTQASQLLTAGWTALQLAHNIIVRHTLADVLGSVDVQANPFGKTTLVVDDSGEVGRAVYLAGNTVAFAGVGPVKASGVQSVEVVVGLNRPPVFVYDLPAAPTTVYNVVPDQISGPFAKFVTATASLPRWDGAYQLPNYFRVDGWTLPNGDWVMLPGYAAVTKINPGVTATVAPVAPIRLGQTGMSGVRVG